MRSRYCAYAMGLVDYILQTTDPAGPAFEHDTEAWRDQVQRFCAQTTFGGLTIQEQHETGDRGSVTFDATLSQQRQDVSFSERSQFTKVDGRWLYHGGEPA